MSEPMSSRGTPPQWLRRLDYKVHWLRFLGLAVLFALLAVTIHDEGVTFCLGYLLGLVVSRYAMTWREP
jgi:hypothetical protein